MKGNFFYTVLLFAFSLHGMGDGDEQPFCSNKYDSLVAWSKKEIELWPSCSIWHETEKRYITQHYDPSALELFATNAVNSKISGFLQSQLLWDYLERISEDPGALLQILTLDIMDTIQPDLITKQYKFYVLLAQSRHSLESLFQKKYRS